MTIRRLFILAAAVLLPMDSIAAENSPRGGISLQIENDVLGTPTDRHYTNGIKLSGLVKTGPLNKFAKWLAPNFPAISHKDIDAVAFSLGHNIFTPENITSHEVVATDRPYAGWFYASLGVLAEDKNRETGVSTLKTVSLDLGVTGPASFGKEIQRGFHKVFDLNELNGWDHQLKNELGLILSFDHKTRRPLADLDQNLEIDMSHNLGFSMGNIYTYGNGGFLVRLGQNLELDYGPPRIRPSLPGSDLVREGSQCLSNYLCSWYLFAGAEGRAIARNIFLDGNTFADSHSVDRKPFVGDVHLGVALTFPAVRLSATHVIRSKEFEGQDKLDRFSAVSLTVPF